MFVRLYDEGLIYRGKRLVNWDPVLKTALSDLEVAAAEENGHLWHMRYPLAEGERLSSWSPRPVRKRCWAMPRSRCIPRMSATGI